MPLPQKSRTRSRRTHFVRPNARSGAPDVRVYVDTEAFIDWEPPATQVQTLWFGWACFERARSDSPGTPTTEEWLRFDRPEPFFELLQDWTRERSCTYVYAHNWYYDAAMLSLATMAEREGWTITEYVPANHLLWLTMRKGTKTLKFIDTLNYFAMSLERLGNDIGVKKTVAEQHPNTVEWWSDYCKQDVNVIRQAMHKYFALITELNLGMYRSTLAGQAYGAWRHRFMKHDVLILADERIEQLERDAYHGGRSEVFYDLPLYEPVTCLDVNSMYPWVMRDNLFPSAKLYKGKKMTLSKLRDALVDHAVIARCIVDTDSPVYAHRTKERVIYPTGRFETTLSSPELRYALDHDHLVEVREYVVYEQQPLFREFVETLYALRVHYREVGNAAFAFLVKIMLNSLYGKFGQRGFHWKRCEDMDDAPFDEFEGNCEVDGLVLQHRRRFGEMWHREKSLEAFESFPAIAAHVTAYARMALYKLRTEAGTSNVYYCDTDSLYVNQEGKERLLHRVSDTTLGGLKVEGEESYAWFRAPKDYRFGTHVKVKGVRGKARQLSDNTYEQWQFESYDRVLARHADGEIRVTLIQKQLQRRNFQSRGEGIGWRTPIPMAV